MLDDENTNGYDQFNFENYYRLIDTKFTEEGEKEGENGEEGEGERRG